MLTLPNEIIELFNPFAPVFHGETTWEKAKVLVVGAILTPGRRTVTAALRVMGLKDDGNYAKYHHVLNRAVWSSLEVAQVLLLLLIRAFSGFQTLSLRVGSSRRKTSVIKFSISSASTV